MTSSTFRQFDPTRVPSPCFVVDEVAIERNLQILDRVQKESGAKILAALKAFSMWSLAPLISRYLSGTCASGLHEARLGREEFGGEVHVFSAAYTESDLQALLGFAHHVVFNSLNQWQRFQPQIQQALQTRTDLAFGIRVNPEHSEGTTPIYDPCAPGSRLGITLDQLQAQLDAGASMDGISGIHFHTLCEQDLPPLARTLAVVEERFARFLPALQWINFGGGHHITRADYDVDGLIELIKGFRARHPHLQVYMEPGEAVALSGGVLVTEVLDIGYNQLPQAIIDSSATCHMPDTLEMPYRPDILGAGQPGEFAHTYRIGGMTCLSGDVINDYSFPAPLQIGDRLVFDEMAHYTMVKTSTFNGINLPSIALWNSATDELRIVKSFGYEDFKQRLS